MSKNGEIYTTGKNFTLPPALTAWTNSTSGVWLRVQTKKFYLRKEDSQLIKGGTQLLVECK